VAALAAILSLLTAFNNFFGFSGVANFARFVAAPLLIAVIAYTFCHAAPTLSVSIFTAVPHHSFTGALTAISGFVIGFAVWGNEPDYWRYGKPGKWSAAVPLAAALAVGEILFPITGWMVAHLSGVTEYGAATNFINVFAFGGMPIVAAIVLSASYSACNDANMYGMINAVENFKKIPHRRVCAVLAVLCGAIAAWLSTSGASKALESITSLNCVFLPTVTVIMIVEFFLVRPFLRQKVKFDAAADLGDLLQTSWAAFAALFAGCLVGVLTSGVIPGIESMHVGICSIQAWLTAAGTYIPLRILEHRFATNSRAILEF
jgi:purine-cytosine permease-like protein